MNKPQIGRPRKFKTQKDLIDTINKYFEDTDPNEYSVTGLALVIGSKQLIQDYEKRKGFKEIVKEAKLIIENSYEISLRRHGRTGDIFALKNFGWTDKQEVDNNVKGEGFIFRIQQCEGDNDKSTGKAGGSIAGII